MNKSTVTWGLIALNVVLLLLLVSRHSVDQPAMAQVGMGGRPGDYLMIPGNVVGGNNAVVYVVDQTSHQLAAMTYDDAMDTFNTMPAINLDRVMNGTR